MPTTGTSFAAPTALRTALGLRAHFGKQLTPLAIKALLLHSCDDAGHDKTEVGWGRIPADVDSIVLTDQQAAHIVYQGELRPASWVRLQIPIPKEPMYIEFYQNLPEGGLLKDFMNPKLGPEPMQIDWVKVFKIP